jgi:hypothetical protein
MKKPPTPMGRRGQRLYVGIVLMLKLMGGGYNPAAGKREAESCIFFGRRPLPPCFRRAVAAIAA